MSALESLIRRGPITLILVYSTTCPHCHTYMPMWEEMCRTKDKRANMVKMEASTYMRTPLAEKKPVDGVPTVLFVDKEGKITEAEQPRNHEVMMNAVRAGVAESTAATGATATQETSEPVPATLSVPGTSASPNPLRAIPGTPIQQGGNPWMAFLSAAARQAAPAAVLLGAYGAMRSSGLGPARRRTRKYNSRHGHRRHQK